MSEDEQKFGGPIKRVIKAKPEELRRRLKTAKTAKDGAGINLQRVDKVPIESRNKSSSRCRKKT